MQLGIWGGTGAGTRDHIGPPGDASGRLGRHGHIRAGSVTTEQSEKSMGLLAVQGTCQGLKSSLDGGASVFVSRDNSLNELFKSRSGESSRLHHCVGDSLQSILTNFQVFAAVGGCAPFAGCAHSKRVGRGGPNDHDVNRADTIFSVGVYNVRPFMIFVVRRDQSFAVNWGVSPVVEELAQGVGDCLMPFDGSGTVGAAHGMVAFGVAKAWAWGAIGTSQGAGAGSKNVVGHPYADSEVENFIRHEMRGLGGEL